MFETCEMKLTILDTKQAGDLRFDVLASEQLCVDPKTSFNPWDYTARLQVTNTGSHPVTLSHADGAVARNAFANIEIMERLPDGTTTTQEVFRRGGPIDKSKVKTTQEILAPGQAHIITGGPTYVMEPLRLARDGLDLNGALIPEANRPHRKFTMKFKASLSAKTPQGMRSLTSTFTIPLTIFLKPDIPDEG